MSIYQSMEIIENVPKKNNRKENLFILLNELKNIIKNNKKINNLSGKALRE